MLVWALSLDGWWEVTWLSSHCYRTVELITLSCFYQLSLEVPCG
jgi:hypothetical protein